ncbi:3',5'-cyclic AMP phosphodiesterase CpdA [Nitrobacteraceae bacterium AZCC 2299]
MAVFRLTQITDSHLSPRYPQFVENFHRVSDYIDTTRPDLVINSGDLAFDGPECRDELEFAKAQHAALPIGCRYLPGNHDIGDNPTQTGAAPTQIASEANRQTFLSIFGEDRWSFDAAGWRFVGLNSLIMNTGLACEDEQFEWLASQLAGLNGKPLALFVHKPLYRNSPDDPELAATAFRYVPMPARRRLGDLLGSVDLRLVACGHVHQRRDYTWRGIRHIWAPSTSFIISDEKQERIGVKEVGLVEYTFLPDAFEVRHLRAPGTD